MWKKLWIISSGVVMLMLSACSTKQYDISWDSLTNFNTKDIELSLTFSNSPRGHQFKKIKLIPNVTTKMEVPTDCSFRSYVQTMNVHVLYHPAPSDIPNGGKMEVFLFNPEVKQISENQFSINKIDHASAYFVEIFKNSKYYYIISKNNLLNADFSNVKTIKPLTSMLEECSNNDGTYYDSSMSEDIEKVPSKLWGGYIVQSKIDGKYLWLDPTN